MNGDLPENDVDTVLTGTIARLRIQAFVALAVTVVGWSLAPVMIRFLSGEYDPFTQGFVRYISGTVALVAVCMTFYRKEFAYALRNSWGLVVLGIMNCGNQTAWTVGCYGAEATVAQLITKINVVFVIVFSFLLFREERTLIRHPIYLAGTALSLVGVAFVLADDPASLAPQFNRYTVLLLCTALGWAVYAVWAKHIVRDVHPVPLFTVIALYTTGGLGIIAAFFGRPLDALDVGAALTLVTVLSGVIPIAASHACYHIAQKQLGAAFCTSVNLINPFFTFSFALLLLPGERLNATQWAGAVVLIAGILAIVWAGQRAAQSARRAMKEAVARRKRADSET